MKTTTRNTVSKYICPALATVALLSFTSQPVSAATDTWTGATDFKWADANWTGGNSPPADGDSLLFAGSGTGTLIDNMDTIPLNPLTVYGVNFGQGGYTVNPNTTESLFLSGQSFGTNTGIANNGLSGSGAVAVNLSLNLDWGFYTFSDGGGDGLTLGGTITLNSGGVINTAVPNAGGVAYFDSTAPGIAYNPALDASGLILGMGGAGLIFNSTGAIPLTPTGLATISSGSVVPYAAFNSFSSGVIPTGLTSANNNILLNASGATAFTAASGVSLNTITANQTGNAGGTATTTLTITGTVTLGVTSGIGGIYALDGTGGAEANLFAVATNGGTGANLTAGSPGVGGSIVIGATDTTPASFAPNAIAEAAIIADNGSGPVSVVKVGSSSVALSGTNTFSGGLYIDQGQVQAGTSFGTGPVYVASSATLFINNAGTVTFNNNFFISPGTGFAGDLASGSFQGSLMPGSIILGTGQVSLGGTMTLQGAPVAISADVTPSAGDRIIGNNTVSYFLNGPIVGTGTLDLAAVPHACTYGFQNTSATPNSWAGGLIIESPLANPSSARTVVVQLGGSGHTQIPHGAGNGDVLLYSGATKAFTTSSSATLNMNGISATINGLWGFAASSSSAELIVENTSTTTSTLTIGDNNATGNYGGVTTDTASTKLLNMVKMGTGTQTFTAALSHHGSTTVNGGSFQLASGSSIPNSPLITVASPGTLDVTGIGTLTLASAQTLDCVGAVLGNVSINGTVESADPTIGTLADTGNLTFGQNSTYIFDVSDTPTAEGGAGTAGTADGWSLLSASGTITINSTTANPMTINVTSLLTSGASGNAANFNPANNYSWPIAYAAGGITINNSSPFRILTSAFGNNANSSSQWTVSVSGNYLMLNYSGFSVITSSSTTPTAVGGVVTINQNLGNAPTTATFSVTANSAYTPTFAWTQGGTPLSGPSGTTAGGGTYTINTVGLTSTLTISGADATVEQGDTSLINVTVTENGTLMATLSQQLNIIDLPYNVNVASYLANENNLPIADLTGSPLGTPIAAGAVSILQGTASGTGPFTYQWYLNGNPISGPAGTAPNLSVNVAANNTGNYTVKAINAAGNATSTAFNIGPVTQVPNQIIFDPLNYPFQTHDQAVAWSALSVSNVYNQATGVPLSWVAASGGDMDCELPNWDQAYVGYPSYDGGIYGNTNIYDWWPWHGLADSFPTTASPEPGSGGLYQDSARNSDVRLPFGTGGSVTSGKVYLSFVINMGASGAFLTAGNDYLCGFGFNNATTTALGIHNAGTFIQLNGNDTYQLGAFKTSTAVGATSLSTVLSPGVNGNWSPNILIRDETIFVVCRLTVDPSGGPSGGSSVALWIDPAPGTFYASEANLPTPDVVDSDSVGAPDVGSPASADFIYSKITQSPPSRTYALFRVGTTWASVTPPAAPTLTVNNASLGCPPANTATFTSTNAGNPVTGGYGWTFNNGSGPVALMDGTQGDGAMITGSQTNVLTIANATAAEVGTYTVLGTNTDQDTSAILTGSGSGTLSFYQPPLSIVYTGTSVVLSWPTSGTSCFVLNKTTSLKPTISWTPVTGGTGVVGPTTTTYTISPVPAVPTYYSLIAMP